MRFQHIFNRAVFVGRLFELMPSGGGFLRTIITCDSRNHSSDEHAFYLTEVGVGVNYNVFDLDVGVKKSDWRGNANISYQGLYVCLSAYW
jgi:hypothetical protein